MQQAVDPAPNSDVLHDLGAELARQDSELARTYRALAGLPEMALRVSDTDLRSIAEATSVCAFTASPAPSPWPGTRC
jgi:hypothetical protein